MDAGTKSTDNKLWNLLQRFKDKLLGANLFTNEDALLINECKEESLHHDEGVTSFEGSLHELQQMRANVSLQSNQFTPISPLPPSPPDQLPVVLSPPKPLPKCRLSAKRCRDGRIKLDFDVSQEVCIEIDPNNGKVTYLLGEDQDNACKKQKMLPNDEPNSVCQSLQNSVLHRDDTRSPFTTATSEIFTESTTANNVLLPEKAGSEKDLSFAIEEGNSSAIPTITAEDFSKRNTNVESQMDISKIENSDCSNEINETKYVSFQQSYTQSQTFNGQTTPLEQKSPGGVFSNNHLASSESQQSSLNPDMRNKGKRKKKECFIEGQAYNGSSSLLKQDSQDNTIFKSEAPSSLPLHSTPNPEGSSKKKEKKRKKHLQSEVNDSMDAPKYSAFENKFKEPLKNKQSETSLFLTMGVSNTVKNSVVEKLCLASSKNHDDNTVSPNRSSEAQDNCMIEKPYLIKPSSEKHDEKLASLKNVNSPEAFETPIVKKTYSIKPSNKSRNKRSASPKIISLETQEKSSVKKAFPDKHSIEKHGANSTPQKGIKSSEDHDICMIERPCLMKPSNGNNIDQSDLKDLTTALVEKPCLVKPVSKKHEVKYFPNGVNSLEAEEKTFSQDFCVTKSSSENQKENSAPPNTQGTSIIENPCVIKSSSENQIENSAPSNTPETTIFENPCAIKYPSENQKEYSAPPNTQDTSIIENPCIIKSSSEKHDEISSPPNGVYFSVKQDTSSAEKPCNVGSSSEVCDKKLFSLNGINSLEAQEKSKTENLSVINSYSQKCDEKLVSPSGINSLKAQERLKIEKPCLVRSSIENQDRKSTFMNDINSSETRLNLLMENPCLLQTSMQKQDEESFSTNEVNSFSKTTFGNDECDKTPILANETIFPNHREDFIIEKTCLVKTFGDTQNELLISHKMISDDDTKNLEDTMPKYSPTLTTSSEKQNKNLVLANNIKLVTPIELEVETTSNIASAPETCITNWDINSSIDKVFEISTNDSLDTEKKINIVPLITVRNFDSENINGLNEDGLKSETKIIDPKSPAKITDKPDLSFDNSPKIEIFDAKNSAVDLNSQYEPNMYDHLYLEDSESEGPLAICLPESFDQENEPDISQEEKSQISVECSSQNSALSPAQLVNGHEISSLQSNTSEISVQERSETSPKSDIRNTISGVDSNEDVESKSRPSRNLRSKYNKKEKLLGNSATAKLTSRTDNSSVAEDFSHQKTNGRARRSARVKNNEKGRSLNNAVPSTRSQIDSKFKFKPDEIDVEHCLKEYKTNMYSFLSKLANTESVNQNTVKDLACLLVSAPEISEALYPVLMFLSKSKYNPLESYTEKHDSSLMSPSEKIITRALLILHNTDPPHLNESSFDIFTKSASNVIVTLSDKIPQTGILALCRVITALSLEIKRSDCPQVLLANVLKRRDDPVLVATVLSVWNDILVPDSDDDDSKFLSEVVTFSILNKPSDISNNVWSSCQIIFKKCLDSFESKKPNQESLTMSASKLLKERMNTGDYQTDYILLSSIAILCRSLGVTWASYILDQIIRPSLNQQEQLGPFLSTVCADIYIAYPELEACNILKEYSKQGCEDASIHLIRLLLEKQDFDSEELCKLVSKYHNSERAQAVLGEVFRRSVIVKEGKILKEYIC